jgi:hypothetical protein
VDRLSRHQGRVHVAARQDYFENSRRGVMSQRAYSIRNSARLARLWT